MRASFVVCSSPFGNRFASYLCEPLSCLLLFIFWRRPGSEFQAPKHKKVCNFAQASFVIRAPPFEKRFARYLRPPLSFVILSNFNNALDRNLFLGTRTYETLRGRCLSFVLLRSETILHNICVNRFLLRSPSILTLPWIGI